MFTEDEQIGNWVSRTNGRYKSKQMPKTCEGMMLHPSAHEFWEVGEIRNNLMEFLVGWSKNIQLYTQR